MGWWLVHMFLVGCVTHWYVTHGNTRQHTATHGNTLQHTATHCNTLQHPFNCAHYWLCDPLICFTSLLHRCNTTHSHVQPIASGVWLQPIAFGVWSKSQSPISFSLASFQRDVTKETNEFEIGDADCENAYCIWCVSDDTLMTHITWWHPYDTPYMMTHLWHTL